MTDSPSSPSEGRSGSEYAASLRDVLEHVAERQSAESRLAEPKKPPFLTRPPVVVALALIFTAVMGWDLVYLRRTPPPPPPEAQQAGANVAVLAAYQAVEHFRKEQGRLPASLEEAGVRDDLAEYRVMADGYELWATVGTRRTEYRSADGPPDLIRKLIPEAQPGGTR